MSRLRYWLQGMVTFSLKRGNEARFYDLAAAKGVRIAAVSKKKGKAEITLASSDYCRLRPLFRASDILPHIEKRYGLPFLFQPIRKRWGFFWGALLFLLLLLIFGRMIWVVEPQGNQLVSDQQILSAAEAVGVSVGGFPKTEELVALEQKTLLQLPELSWLVFNRSGSRVTIRVSERRMPILPADKKNPAHLVAECDGVLVRQEVFMGESLLKPGQAFLKGDVLVSAYLYGNNTNQSVCADARIFARVQRDFEIRLPLQGEFFLPTGRQKQILSFRLFGKEYAIGNCKFPLFDRLKKEKNFYYFEDRLPVSFTLETYRELEAFPQKRKIEEVRTEAVWRMNEALKEALGDQGVLEEVFYSFSEEKGELILRAETQMILPVGVYAPAQEVPPQKEEENR